MSLRSLWSSGGGGNGGRPEPIVTDSDPLLACLQLERFGVITARPDLWRDHGDYEEVNRKALEAIDDSFSLVPEGFVSLSGTLGDGPSRAGQRDQETEPFLLGRCAVTNSQYYRFVEAGGYEELELWPEDIWPHLIAFRDVTENPGPRYWHNSNFDSGCENHPVVGICFYEAAAYAHWVGFRLPTEVEWQMAASWRIRSGAHGSRTYPWGQSFDQKRCNLWASGVDGTVDVDDQRFMLGEAPNGVLQLIGNVWEWTSTNLVVTDDSGREVRGDMLLKGVRGGAFDTYFSAQATSDFRTGLACLARTKNTGVRLAADVPTGE